MSDIVERLRPIPHGSQCQIENCVRCEAADEIERLRGLLREVRRAIPTGVLRITTADDGQLPERIDAALAGAADRARPMILSAESQETLMRELIERLRSTVYMDGSQGIEHEAADALERMQEAADGAMREDRDALKAELARATRVIKAAGKHMERHDYTSARWTLDSFIKPNSATKRDSATLSSEP